MTAELRDIPLERRAAAARKLIRYGRIDPHNALALALWPDADLGFYRALARARRVPRVSARRRIAA